jgi:hypothetical protein
MAPVGFDSLTEFSHPFIVGYRSGSPVISETLNPCSGEPYSGELKFNGVCLL